MHHHHHHSNRGGVTVRVGGCFGTILFLGITVFTLSIVGGALACAGMGGMGHAHYSTHHP